jgi:hypothetical protein
LSIPIEYGLPLVQVTDTVVLPVTADAISVVPGTLDPKFRVAALMEQAAVIVICTVRLAVAVPAWAELSQIKIDHMNRVATAQMRGIVARRFHRQRKFMKIETHAKIAARP